MKLRNFLHKSLSIGKLFAYSVRRAKDWYSKRGRLPKIKELPILVRRALYEWPLSGGVGSPGSNLEFNISKRLDPYEAWLDVNKWNSKKETYLKRRLEKSKTSPLLSVIMPVYNTPPNFLELAIRSVREQVYENWELCIADDASSDNRVHQVLNKWREEDTRIKVRYSETNGDISIATNAAASMAAGEYLVFLDHDDELSPDALGEIALYVTQNPHTDLLYSDDDKIGINRKRFAPQFKPDWSPELLLSYMYFSHAFVVRRTLFEEIGGARVGFEGSQDYDIALRASEKARHVGHIPLVLYHWRVLANSTASSGGAKPKSFEAGRKAVQEALDRRGISAEAYQPDWAIKAGCGIFSHKFSDNGPSVAILIPTKNQFHILKRCIDSIKLTTYRNYKVFVIDNGSDDQETIAYLKQTSHKVLRIPNPGDSFNYAAINNNAVQQVNADYILFLNNDTEVLNPRWLSQMVGYAGFAGVGAVGARLLFPDGRIQHAGIIHGLYHGMAGPAFKLAPSWDHGYLSYAIVARNYSAVTAACLLTPRKLFSELGGFDEERFAVAYNDVVYCYRLVDKGYRCVYCPDAELIHHEGYSRSDLDNPTEVVCFKRKYAERIDPWYNPHLSLVNERFETQPRIIVHSPLKPIPTLMCAFTLNWEGAPFSQYEMTVRLKEKGIVDPIVYCHQDGPLRQAYEDKGIAVYIKKHPLSGVFTLNVYEEAISDFAQFIKELGVELVYGNTLQTFYAIAAAHKLGIPSIWNPRESEPWHTYFNNFGAKIAAKALECFRYPYRVIFVADATRDGYLPLNTHHNFTVIHNGLNLERLDSETSNWPRERARQSFGLDDREIAILLLGTVCDRKGQHDLPRALSRLPGKLYCKIKCFIVGDRPSEYSQQLLSIVTALPLDLREKIEIIPETDDTTRYYQAADIFVCTSRIESYPRVILEAMAFGLPIITTPVFGIKEQVQKDINGIFYEPGNVDSLAKALERLIRDSEMRKRMSENSKQVLQTLTNFEEMTNAYGKIFKEAYFSK